MRRRTFLGLIVTAASTAVAGIIAVPAVILGISPAIQYRRRAAWHPIGSLQNFPPGEVRQAQIEIDRSVWPRTLGPRAVFVWRSTDDECVVFSRSCTDLGCPLEYEPGSACFFCPCHGGIFRQNGERLAGPPNRPMYRYASRVRDGLIEIDLASLPAGV